MTPEIREFFMKLPLFHGSLDAPSDLIGDDYQENILFQFQKLFVTMQANKEAILPFDDLAAALDRGPEKVDDPSTFLN